MKKIKLFFMILGGLALLYMIYDYGLLQLKKDLETAGPWAILLVLTFLPTLFCYSAAWSLLTEWKNPLSLKNLWRMIRMMSSSIAWNNLTPFLKVAGEPAKVFMLASYVGRREALMSTIIYNVVHLLATLFSFVIVGFSLPLFFQLNKTLSYTSYFVGAISLAVFILFLFFPFLWKKIIFKWGKNNKSLIRLRWATRKSNRFFKKNFARVVGAFFLEVFARFVEGLTFFLAFFLLKNPITLTMSAFLDVGRTLVDTIFFFVPYQVGSREQGILILLNDIFSQPTTGYLTAVFMYRFVELSWVVLGYLFWMRSRSSRKSVTS